MNKNYTYKTILLLIIFGLSYQSCEDFLDEESLTDVSLDFVYTTEEGLNSALVGLYHLNRLHHNNTASNSFRTLVMPVKSDLAVVRTGEIGLWAWLRWGDSPIGYEGTLLHGYWKHYYKIVDRCNAIIHGAQQSDLDQEILDKLIAEVKTMRANAYFTLYRMFNNIYVRTEPTSPENAFIRIEDKSSVEEIFNLLKEDLEFAIEHLDWNSVSYGRLTKGTAHHIRAKVALWEEDWQAAAENADAVIESGYHSLVPNLQDVFDGINDHSETLFNIQFESDIAGGGNRTLINWNFTPNYGLINGATYSEEMGGKGGGFIYPNNYLLSLFDQDDQRLDNTYFRMKYYYNDPNSLPAGVSLGDEIDIYQPTGNTQSFYYQRLHPGCLKFTPPAGFDPTVGTQYANYIIYRLAETYLIGSEAYMRMNGNGDAKSLQYINAIRNRAGVTPLSYVDQTEILNERARELAFEGQRWYTLKRMGVLYNQIILYAGDDGYKDEARENMQPHFINLPIPQDELDLLGSNYPQNDGY